MSSGVQKLCRQFPAICRAESVLPCLAGRHLFARETPVPCASAARGQDSAPWGRRALALPLHMCRSMRDIYACKPGRSGDAMNKQAREKTVAFIGLGMMGGP